MLETVVSTKYSSINTPLLRVFLAAASLGSVCSNTAIQGNPSPILTPQDWTIVFGGSVVIGNSVVSPEISKFSEISFEIVELFSSSINLLELSTFKIIVGA